MVIMTCTLRALAHLRAFTLRSSLRSLLRSSHSFEGSIFVAKGAEESNQYFFIYLVNIRKRAEGSEERTAPPPPHLGPVEGGGMRVFRNRPFCLAPAKAKPTFHFKPQRRKTPRGGKVFISDLLYLGRG